MTKFIESCYVREMCEATQNLYLHGWDERNGGNVSYRLTSEEVEKFEGINQIIRHISFEFDASKIANCYFLVTGTGRYFKNVIAFPERDMGLVRVSPDGKGVDLLWGFNDGGMPTSEFPTHLMSHIVRMEQDSEQRVIMHCHPTYLIATSFTFELNENQLTKMLWKMQTESLVVFPDGVGIIPWMVPGTDAIGEATAAKMQKFHSVLWPHHGLFAAGKTLDETYGLIETIEKACQIWTFIQAQGGKINQEISDQELQALADTFGVTPKVGVLDIE